MACAFARQGAHIGLVARGGDGLVATRREVEELGGRCSVLPTDVADADQVDPTKQYPGPHFREQTRPTPGVAPEMDPGLPRRGELPGDWVAFEGRKEKNALACAFTAGMGPR